MGMDGFVPVCSFESTNSSTLGVLLLEFRNDTPGFYVLCDRGVWKVVQAVVMR